MDWAPVVSAADVDSTDSVASFASVTSGVSAVLCASFTIAGVLLSTRAPSRCVRGIFSCGWAANPVLRGARAPRSVVLRPATAFGAVQTSVRPADMCGSTVSLCHVPTGMLVHALQLPGEVGASCNTQRD
ncbi:hypothetical protein K8P10_001719 [Leucobacter sp. Psy1]|nr:hypothetical protein K8P10_001719 [Leucobacter sp. Psy1]